MVMLLCYSNATVICMYICMNVCIYVCIVFWEGVVPLVGGFGMSFPGQLIHHWSPPEAQLSSLAPKTCLYVTAATARVTALTGWLKQVRLVNRFQTLSELGTCLSQHAEIFPVDWVEETTWIQQS